MLKLVSLPNLLLTWCRSQNHLREEGELDIDDQVLQQFLANMESQNVELNFISGTWGLRLTQLILGLEDHSREHERLVLASETIYSPTSVDAFIQTLGGLLDRVQQAEALVAAKKIYSGVGGAVDDFCS